MIERLEFGSRNIVVPPSRPDLNEAIPDIDPSETVFSLDLEVLPNTRSHVVPPGTYRLGLKIAGANCTVTDWTVDFTLTGKWFAEENRMFQEGIAISIQPARKPLNGSQRA